MLVQVEGVVIPVEQGLSGCVQLAEQSLFHFVQHVESHEHIGIVGELLYVHRFRHLAVEHSFVGDALFAESFLVLRIDVAQHVPQRDETSLQFRDLLDGEIAEKLAQCFLLSLLQKVIFSRQLVQVFQVAEQGLRVDQVLVGIVEITDEHLAPEIKIV